MNSAELERGEFPADLKTGDFIQLSTHFGDIFFEVIKVLPPLERSDYWHVVFVSYGKYAGLPKEDWCNSASRVRSVVAAEMAEPVMRFKHQRFHAVHGQFDPLYGYAPRGTPLRTRST